jgi:glycosyltransferase involved in cell wall biosynthesis
MPDISIITATCNSARTIRDTLESVKNQKIPAEHIIIDGKSSDETLSIVYEYPHVSKIISEPDKGIYDAMNKGIGLCSSEIVGILNSDDFYADDTVLEKVFKAFSDPVVDACYGDLDYVSFENANKVIRRWKASPFSRTSFFWGWMPPHPTFFVRRKLYEQYGKFRLRMGSAADYELMLRFLLKNRAKAAYIPSTLVKMRAGGESNKSLMNRFKANRNDRKAWDINGLRPLPWTILCKPLRKIGQFIG